MSDQKAIRKEFDHAVDTRQEACPALDHR